MLEANLDVVRNVPILTAPAMVMAGESADAGQCSGLPDAAQAVGPKLSREHLLLHLPRRGDCEGCRLAKVKAAQARRMTAEDSAAAAADNFGDLITLDHLVPSKHELPDSGERFALVLLDLATRFSAVYCDSNRSAETVLARIGHFMGSMNPVKIHSDCAGELRLAATRARALHQTSAPYRPRSNGIVERHVQTVTQAARVLLQHAGLPLTLWPYAVQFAAVALNAKEDGGMSPWRRRFGEPCAIPLRPFGCLCSFRKCADKTKLTKFEGRGEHGILLGYHFQPGWKWNREMVVASLPSVCQDRVLEVHRLLEVEFPDDDLFPLARARDQAMERQLAERFVAGELPEPPSGRGRRRARGRHRGPRGRGRRCWTSAGGRALPRAASGLSEAPEFLNRGMEAAQLSDQKAIR